MSFKETEITPDMMSYVKPPIINGLRNLIYTANELHQQHNNNTMSDAIKGFLLAALGSLEFDKGKAASSPKKASKEEKSQEPSQHIPVEPDNQDEDEGLFDSREEAIEALGLPADKSEANKLKLLELVRITYGVGNEDPIDFLELPSKEEAEAMKKKSFLSLIYGD